MQGRRIISSSPGVKEALTASNRLGPVCPCCAAMNQAASLPSGSPAALLSKLVQVPVPLANTDSAALLPSKSSSALPRSAQPLPHALNADPLLPSTR